MAVSAVLLAGLEVVFIVIALGSGRAILQSASIGTLTPCLAVHALFGPRPLARVPETTRKLGVGVMLSAFGVFWTGEGLGVAWPGEDLAILLFAALFLAAGLVSSTLGRRISVEITQ